MVPAAPAAIIGIPADAVAAPVEAPADQALAIAVADAPHSALADAPDAALAVAVAVADAPDAALAVAVAVADAPDAALAVAIPVAPAALPTLPPPDLAPLPRKPQMIAPVQSPAVERVRSTREQLVGDDGERLAAIRLEALGWRILARNLRIHRAEVDILAIDPSEPPSLVLVEVRRRNRRDFGLAEETVDHRKRSSLRRAAGELAMRPVLGDGRRLPDLPVRVDLIAIDRGPDGRPSLRHHRGIDV